MQENGFFALLWRMKYIDRWSLMRNVRKENLTEHSYETAVVAHTLAAIGKCVYNRQTEPERVALAALYHDCGEIITGDMPTPVKYENNRIKSAYKQVERGAVGRLVSMIPEDIQGEFMRLFTFEQHEPELYRYIKAADKITAYLKCISERQGGNLDFLSAEKQLLQQIEIFQMEEVDYFMEHLAPHFGKTLDSLINKGEK